jgi:hypothetical protein
MLFGAMEAIQPQAHSPIETFTEFAEDTNFAHPAQRLAHQEMLNAVRAAVERLDRWMACCWRLYRSGRWRRCRRVPSRRGVGFTNAAMLQCWLPRPVMLALAPGHPSASVNRRVREHRLAMEANSAVIFCRSSKSITATGTVATTIRTIWSSAEPRGTIAGTTSSRPVSSLQLIYRRCRHANTEMAVALHCASDEASGAGIGVPGSFAAPRPLPINAR